MHRRDLLMAATAILTILMPALVRAEDEFERPPINYGKTTPANPVSALQQKLDTGVITLEHDDTHGYLADVLRHLEVPVSSQMLVFSKTSLQMRLISPSTPRALYFNDDIYVGFCQSGVVLEISVADPQLGAVFYTMDQDPAENPKFERRVENCIVCHSSSRTEGVPGHLVRSLYVDTRGTPILSSGSRVVDHTTPLKDRWGGWYVTGTHGAQTHLGNLVIEGRRTPEPVDNTAGQNVENLNGLLETNRYLSPHSDIVALMVLEHQALVHNRLTKANFVTRQTLASQETTNKMLKKPSGTRLDSTTRRIQAASEELVEALLLVGEANLTEPIAGTSGFAQTFPLTGPHDKAGRSLRDLDLTTRLLRYPCSYLIYSDSFDGLPDDVKGITWRRLWEVLSGQDQSDRFAHLAPDDRQAILEILRQTKSDLPDYWHANRAVSLLSPSTPDETSKVN